MTEEQKKILQCHEENFGAKKPQKTNSRPLVIYTSLFLRLTIKTNRLESDFKYKPNRNLRFLGCSLFWCLRTASKAWCSTWSPRSFFDIFIMVMICLNMVTMMVETDDQSKRWNIFCSLSTSPSSCSSPGVLSQDHRPALSLLFHWVEHFWFCGGHSLNLR